MPAEVTAIQNLPSKRGSRLMRARFSASASRPEMVSMGCDDNAPPGFQVAIFGPGGRAPQPRRPRARYAPPWCALRSAAIELLSSGRRIAGQRREQLGEALEAAGPSLLVPVARGNRREDSLMECHIGAPVALGKRDR